MNKESNIDTSDFLNFLLQYPNNVPKIKYPNYICKKTGR